MKRHVRAKAELKGGLQTLRLNGRLAMMLVKYGEESGLLGFK